MQGKCRGHWAREGNTQARRRTETTFFSLAPGRKALQGQAILGVSLGRCGSLRGDCQLTWECPGSPPFLSLLRSSPSLRSGTRSYLAPAGPPSSSFWEMYSTAEAELRFLRIIPLQSAKSALHLIVMTMTIMRRIAIHGLGKVP